MDISFKIIQVVLLSSVKFLFAPTLAIGYGFNFWQTIVMTSAGGIMGVFFFYYLSSIVIRLYRLAVKKIRKALNIPCKPKTKNLSKKKFTRKNKLIIRLRGRFGMLGIIILTPCVLSIPLGCFLVNKYYCHHKIVTLYLSISVMAWSVVLSLVYFFF